MVASLNISFLYCLFLLAFFLYCIVDSWPENGGREKGNGLGTWPKSDSNLGPCEHDSSVCHE